MTRCTRVSGDAREPPLRSIDAVRLYDALCDDLDDELLGDMARGAQLREAELDRVVEQQRANQVRHDAPSIAARGLNAKVAAICRYCASPAVSAAGGAMILSTTN